MIAWSFLQTTRRLPRNRTPGSTQPRCAAPTALNLPQGPRRQEPATRPQTASYSTAGGTHRECWERRVWSRRSTDPTKLGGRHGIAQAGQRRASHSANLAPMRSRDRNASPRGPRGCRSPITQRSPTLTRTHHPSPVVDKAEAVRLRGFQAGALASLDRVHVDRGHRHPLRRCRRGRVCGGEVPVDADHCKCSDW